MISIFPRACPQVILKLLVFSLSSFFPCCLEYASFHKRDVASGQASSSAEFAGTEVIYVTSLVYFTRATFDTEFGNAPPR